MARFLVMGASAGIGAETVRSARAAGHAVRAFARGADKIQPEEGVEPFAGDALDAGDVERALDGVDAVIQTLGVPITRATVFEGTTLFSRATGVLVPLMERAGPRRLVAVTGFGSGDSRGAMSTLEKLGHGAVLGRIYEDKTRQEETIRGSSLDWTIVRPTILTKGARKGSFRVVTDPAEWRNGLISRGDVADFLVRCAAEAAHVREAPVITN